MTKFLLDTMEQNQRYSSQKGVYSRRIRERFLIEAPFSGNWSDLDERAQTVTALFHDPLIQKMVPLFPAGIVIRCESHPVSYSFFVQVLHPHKQDARVIRIPEADFSCVQLEINPQMDLMRILRQCFHGKKPEFAIVSNMPLAKTSFNSRHSEIQIPAL